MQHNLKHLQEAIFPLSARKNMKNFVLSFRRKQQKVTRKYKCIEATTLNRNLMNRWS